MDEIPQRPVKVIVKECARCGETHPMLFHEFKRNPIRCDGSYLRWWGMCDIAGEPVLLAQQEVIPSGIGKEEYE